MENIENKLTEFERSKIRLECVKIVYQAGSMADRNGGTQVAEVLYNFCVGKSEKDPTSEKSAPDSGSPS